MTRTMRMLSPEERRFLETVVSRYRDMLRSVSVLIAVLLTLWTVFFVLIMFKASNDEQPMILGASALVGLLLGMLLRYLRRRAKCPLFTIEDGVRSAEGRVHTEERGGGKTRRTLYFVGDAHVVAPDHWYGTHLKIGDDVSVQGYLVTQKGIDCVFSPDYLLLLTVDGRASVTRDVSLGLLHMKGPLMSISAMLLGIAWAAIAVAQFFGPVFGIVGVFFLCTLIGAVRNYRFNRKLIRRMLAAR